MKKHSDHGEERDVRMSQVQRTCDQQNLPYPPELVQHLAAKVKERGDDSR